MQRCETEQLPELGLSRVKRNMDMNDSARNEKRCCLASETLCISCV